MASPSPKDAQHLLAFIARTQQRPNVREVRLTEIPSNSPIRDSPHRLAPVLDSIANLCVKDPHHEVVAVALRLHKTLELIISTNAGTPPATVGHLRALWRALQKLSVEYNSAYGDSSESEVTPPRPEYKSLTPEAQTRIDEIHRECLKFSWERVKKRVNNKIQKFAAINRIDMHKDSPFCRVYTCISNLEALYTRENDPLTPGKPKTDEEWRTLWNLLKVTERNVDKFIDTGGLRAEDLWRVKGNWDYRQWLAKIVSVTKDVEVLMSAASSPRCKDIFSKEIKIIPLGAIATANEEIPNTKSHWIQVVENALKIRNDHRDEGTEELEVVPSELERDLAKIMPYRFKGKNIVHCEVHLLTHIHLAETEGRLPRAYTYLGISKLSCRGCEVFMQAFNKVHSTRFITKGRHHKAYYPWCFPPNCPKSSEVVQEMTVALCKRFANQYIGFRPKLAPFDADSDAQTLSSRHKPEPHPKEAEDFAQVLTNRPSGLKFL
jgi:nucleic acid/nucleotide deaminase of polymorphic system toxin